jgi:hypothetical protein
VKCSLLIGLLLALVAIPASPAAAATRNCGNYDGTEWSDEPPVGAGIFNVRAKNTACSTARRVVLRAYSTNPDGRKKWRYGKWSCTTVRQLQEGAETRCTRGGGRVVRWQSGA